MTVRVKRTFEFDTPGECIWEFIADPTERARAINVADRFDVSGDGRHATWYFELPTPLVRSAVTIETENIEVDESTHVKPVGKLRVMRATGEHTIKEHDGGSRLVSEFIVDGRLPGVKTFSERNLDRELDSLETGL